MQSLALANAISRSPPSPIVFSLLLLTQYYRGYCPKVTRDCHKASGCKDTNYFLLAKHFLTFSKHFFADEHLMVVQRSYDKCFCLNYGDSPRVSKLI